MSLILKLVRHGESLANTRELEPAVVGDHTIDLTERGREQSRKAGREIGPAFLEGSLVFISPFRRARESLAGMVEGAGLARDSVRVYEDPRLREVEHGYVDTVPHTALRRAHGRFYYRFQGGESPADCYDRTTGFLESVMRKVERNQADRVLIVTHGLTIRCFVMRFLHLTVEQFDEMASPHFGDVITLAMKEQIVAPMFMMGRWGVAGLRRRVPDAVE